VSSAAPHPRRSIGALVALALGAIALFCVFVQLGTWQVHRRAWKLDLIARVQERVHAPVVAPPAPEQWPWVTAVNSEYRHLQVSGTFLNSSETLVQALTDLGSGFWVLTPLRQADGTLVLVNRGFVPPERRERAAHGAAEAETPATVMGLLRISEPKGFFLRKNDPARDVWYSRDVAAIAAARGLGGRVAPYFIDADAGAGGAADVAGPAGVVDGPASPAIAGASSSAAPVGGLTVIAFRNTHLVYAVTWYGLALLVAGAAWIVVREERRRA
jgi:surfeit locus 1 family protein